MAPRKSKKSTKHTIKFIAGCQHREIIEQILRKADPSLVKAICNAAYNVTQGDIPLSRGEKKLFSKYRPVLAALTDRDTTIQKKQKIVQSGGLLPILAGILPAVLGAVITTVGSAIFNR